MIVTEEQARGKWCPFARRRVPAGNGDQAVTVNRMFSGEPFQGCMCIASGCMAWLYVTDSMEYGRCGAAM